MIRVVMAEAQIIRRSKYAILYQSKSLSLVDLIEYGYSGSVCFIKYNQMYSVVTLISLNLFKLEVQDGKRRPRKIPLSAIHYVKER